MLTIHKLLPIFFFIKIIALQRTRIVLTRIVLTRILVSDTRTLFFTVIYSSIINSIWLLIGVLIRLSFVFLYWVVYSFITGILIFSFTGKTLYSYNQNSLRRIRWLVLRGTPPFVFFWIKVFIIFRGLITLRPFYAFTIVLARVFLIREIGRAHV